MAGEGIGLWDEQDGFYYDVLHLPDGTIHVLKVRSMVGLIPLFAVETLEPELLERLPGFRRRLEWFLEHKPELAALVSHWHVPGRGERRLLSLLRGHRMTGCSRACSTRASSSRPRRARRCRASTATTRTSSTLDGQPLHASTTSPAESDTGLFGGNSNWRGPVWFPVNYLLIEALQKFHHYYGDDFQVECPPARAGR